MPNTRAIAEVLRYSDDDIVDLERRGFRWRRVSIAVVLLFFALCYAVVIWRAVLSWGDGQWDTRVWPTMPADPSLWMLWFMQLPMASVFMLWYWEGEFLLAQSRMRPGLAQLRDAASDGDEQLAPHAAVQPVPFPSSLLSSSAVPVLLPSHLGDSNTTRLTNLSFGALSFSMIGMAVLAIILPASDSVRTVGLINGGIILAALIASWLLLRRLPGPLRWEQAKITVDADGLSWRHGTGMWAVMRTLLDTRLIRAPWQELRAFLTFACKDSGIEHRLYALVTTDEMFTWEVRGDSPADASERSDLLCRLVATYTLLPLRDVSAAVATLDDVTPRTAARWSEEVREARSTHVSLSPMKRRGTHWRFRPAMPGLIVLTLLPFLLYLSSYAVQRYQSHMYATLLAQVHAHAPHYHDALNVADSDWPILQPTAEGGKGYVFAHGAYQLSGEMQDGYTSAYTSNQSSVVDGDMAVEVTARQYGGPDNLGVGLTLSANRSDEDPILFTVAPSGEWQLHTQAQTNSLSSSQGKQYVHGQAGAPNRLTLIVRKGEYICYINDQFVGISRAPIQYPLHVGVVIQGAPSMTGAFTDFTVYPV